MLDFGSTLDCRRTSSTYFQPVSFFPKTVSQVTRSVYEDPDFVASA
jgi:hypothetical protein